MRAIEYTQNGPADVLNLVERRARTAGPGEVRVLIAVSGVNPTDWKSRLGVPGTRLPVAQVPNQDGAGIVEGVGPGVKEFAPGDRVWVWNAAYQRADGTAQELTIVPTSQVVSLPDGVSFDVGASIGIPALTAHRALTSRDSGPSRLAPEALSGVVVLVAGGAGAVGHAAIQLAVWAGAVVIATVSGEGKARLAKAAGANHVINYRTDDVVTRIREISDAGVDIIVEVNAVANLELDLEILALRGTISIYAGNDADQPPIPIRKAMTKNARLQFLLTYLTSDDQKRSAIEAITDALRNGVLAIGAENGLPITRFPLEATADAHRAVESGVIGKVLIDVATL